jgi:YD repeat-containing protein
MRLQTSLTSRWVGNESMCWWKWVIVFVFALLLISSCDGRSLSDIDLEPLLIQPGDLPNELTAGSVKVIEPDPDVLRHDQALEQEIVTRNGDLAGVVRVYLFRSKPDRDNAYDLFSLLESQEGIVPYSVPPIGDFTSARHTDKGGFEVVFVRCHAVTVIWLRTAGDYLLKNDHVVQYAQQIDHRLASAVCPWQKVLSDLRPLNRLTSAAYSTGERFEYAYDAVGNRTVMTDTTGVTTDTDDAASRLTSVGGVAYTWDERENLTSDGSFTYTYNGAGRLVRVEGVTLTLVYTYNANGLRVSQSVDGEQTTFAWDWASGLPEMLSDGGNLCLVDHETLARWDGAAYDHLLCGELP